ncbi:hypothetical protein Y1Q_0011644 [Alligator mississippiensis]|uniref:Uncharacterized protein n=1 Tax=Alligator mississippiensis TaxID=8496 RepID=A0A151M0J6_ALLMI|nr:hypothetical protein Y1Q_0011644 [Alligator mississippiensis]
MAYQQALIGPLSSFLQTCQFWESSNHDEDLRHSKQKISRREAAPAQKSSDFSKHGNPLGREDFVLPADHIPNAQLRSFDYFPNSHGNELD